MNQQEFKNMISTTLESYPKFNSKSVEYYMRRGKRFYFRDNQNKTTGVLFLSDKLKNHFINNYKYGDMIDISTYIK